MQDLNLPSLIDLPPVDLTPLVWTACIVLGLFALSVILVLPIAILGTGTIGDNARAAFDKLLKLFHALIDAFRRGGR